MKSVFLYGVIFLIPVALVGWVLYKFGQSLLSMYEDWRISRGLGTVREDREILREQLRVDNDKRLATGCGHDFEDHGLGLPPGTCSKCGMESQKPSGMCDHVWKLCGGAVPGSKCEKCGEEHDHATTRGGFGPS